MSDYQCFILWKDNFIQIIIHYTIDKLISGIAKIQRKTIQKKTGFEDVLLAI